MDSKVSIIVPVYNVEKYLHKCVRSLLNQTYENLEIILVDDESTDRCPQICDEYAASYPQIRVIHIKNSGTSGARKRGLDQATGTKIAFVDSDDWILPSMIKEMVTAAEMHAADIVICGWREFKNGEEGGKEFVQLLDNNAPTEQIRDEFLMNRHVNCMCNKLFDKELFSGIQFPKNMIGGDFYVHGELICRCRKFYYLSKPLYCYRIHASFSKTQPKIRRKYGGWLAWRERERVCEKYGFAEPLQYNRLLAQESVISLLAMNRAKPELKQQQDVEAEMYLQKCKRHPAVGLTLRYKIEWWALENSPALARFFGRLSLWAEAVKQKKITKKQQ